MPSKLHTEDGQSLFENEFVDNYSYPQEFLNFLATNGTMPREDSLYVFQQTVRVLNLFGTPLILIIGFVGNSLSFVVFTATYLRYQSASMYLAFLNFVDTMFLVCVLVNWLQFLGINVMNQNGVCQTMVYVSYVSSFLSVYTVVSFTTERWVIMYKPLRKSTLCTRKNALIVLSSLTVGSLMLYSFTIWTTMIEVHERPTGSHRACTSSPKFHKLESILTTVDTIITLIIPSIVIIVLNIGVTIKIWRFVSKTNQGKRRLMAEDASFVKYPASDKKNSGLSMSNVYLFKKPSTSHRTSTNTTRQIITSRHLQSTMCTRSHMQLRTTRALLIVSTVFVVLNFPSHVFRSHVFITYLLDSTYIFPKHVLLWQHICQILYYANFSVNFFLYSACSRTFRNALKRLHYKLSRRTRTSWRRGQAWLQMKLSIQDNGSNGQS